MHYLIFSLVLSALISSFSISAQTESKQATYALIRCESVGNAENYCKVDTSPGVWLVRELSNQRCIENRTFRVDRGGIRVNGGCAAEFEIGNRNSSYHHPDPNNGSVPLPGSGHILCESNNNERNYCAADTSNGVRLIRQLSRNKCIENNSWGYNHHAIWTDRGCRGEFELLSNHNQYGYGRPGEHRPSDPRKPPFIGIDPSRVLATLICKSIKNQQTNCPATIGRNRVELIRQISKKPCIQGQFWGFDRSRIWVSNGCRAEFAVVRASKPILLSCESPANQRQYCPADTLYGVRIQRQLSRAPCIENQTWGYGRNAIWVDRGCRAEFLLP